MQNRRSSSGRPSGTDGSDFSYRMVVESRYTNVARFKSRLSSIFLIQGIIVLTSFPVILLPLIKGKEHNVLAVSSVMVGLLAIIFGESGRRHSQTALLKIYIILSFVSILLSVFCAMKSNLLWEIPQSGLTNIWEKERAQLIEVVRIMAGIVVQIFAAMTTLSLIHNMSPPKKSS